MPRIVGSCMTRVIFVAFALATSSLPVKANSILGPANWAFGIVPAGSSLDSAPLIYTALADPGFVVSDWSFNILVDAANYSVAELPGSCVPPGLICSLVATFSPISSGAHLGLLEVRLTFDDQQTGAY